MMSKDQLQLKVLEAFGPEVGEIHYKKRKRPMAKCCQKKSQEVHEACKSLKIYMSVGSLGRILAAKTMKLSVCMELNIGAQNCCFRRGLQQKMWFCEADFCCSLVTTTGITRALVLAITSGGQVTPSRG